MLAKCTKVTNARAKRAKLLFLLLNIHICDVLRGCLGSQMWLKHPYIRLIAMTIFSFSGGGLLLFSG